MKSETHLGTIYYSDKTFLIQNLFANIREELLYVNAGGNPISGYIAVVMKSVYPITLILNLIVFT